jgi:hypothetical protein
MRFTTFCSTSTGPLTRRALNLTSASAVVLMLAALFGGSAPSSMASDLSSFDCYAVTPRSHAYDIGDYGSALKELEPLASDACPRARRLLAVMHAKGQGVPQNVVLAYAYLLLAFSEGVTPFGGSDRSPVLGSDPNEFEIVQLGLQLSDQQLAAAGKLAAKLASSKTISITGAVGPNGIENAIKELRPLRAAYRFNGKLAVLGFPQKGSPLVVGMRRIGSDRILAQLVTDLNGVGIPHELLSIESKLGESRALKGKRIEDVERDIDLAISNGVHFTWLKLGEEVRMVRFGFNSSFASQVSLASDRGGGSPPVYWIDSCFLRFKDAREQQAAFGVRAGCP